MKKIKMCTDLEKWFEIDEPAEESETCVICQDHLGKDDKVVRISCCATAFHADCAEQMMEHRPECPVCRFIMEPLTGSCPPGTMTHRVSGKFIHIQYHIPDGIQGPEHPSPGSRFTGTSRSAFLPNTAEGKKVLGLLKRAFDARLTFTVGTSLTTGQKDVVIWAGIHHKTSTAPGPFGYPDPTYLERVQQELKSKGISQDDDDAETSTSE